MLCSLKFNFGIFLFFTHYFQGICGFYYLKLPVKLIYQYSTVIFDSNKL